MRIALIGAGSALFTKGILGSLITDHRFEDCSLVLMDINPEILSLMERYAQRLVRDNHSPLKIEATTSLGRALDGADFVVCTVAADDAQARKIEIDVPLSFGYHHSWGDTTGPSGVFRALRHIPIFLEIASEIRQRCPEAWLLNFTNPMAALCGAVSRESSIKNLGFCDGPPFFKNYIEKEILELPEGSLQIKMAGVDHLVWILEMTKDGEDVYPEFRSRAGRVRKRFPVDVEILETYGYLPCPGDEHTSEFFPFFLKDLSTMRKYGLKDMDISWHRQRRVENMEAVRREVKSSEPLKPVPLLPEDEVLEIIQSIINDEQKEFIACLLNRNVISNLPDYAVVEAPVKLGAEVYRLPPVLIPPHLTGVLHSSIVKDELTIQAAVTGSKELVFQAVLMCPLINSIDQARDICSAMLEALKDYLPINFV